MTDEVTTPTPKTRTTKPKMPERNIAAELAEPFRPEAERILNKGGTQLTYLPYAEVVTRLNNVFGVANWSSEILRCERDSYDSEFVIAHVRVTAVIDGVTVIHEGFGGQKIKRTKSGDPLDLGDEFKGAVSDALKKAAQQYGVGLYLARHDDVIEAEQAQAAIEEIQPEVRERWENFMSFARSLTEEQRNELNEFWTNHAGSRPKPTIQTATVKDLDALIAECFRITTNGTVVE